MYETISMFCYKMISMQGILVEIVMVNQQK